MDWTMQAEEMITTWTRVQQKMWESWLNAMQVAAPHSPETWEQALELWSNSVREALQAQVAWIQFWVTSVMTGSSSPKEVAGWFEHVLDMTQRWADTQTQLSEYWFDTMKKSHPSTLSRAWDMEEAQHVMHSWQEASQKLLEAQLGWLQLWTAAQVQQKEREVGA